MFEPITNDVIKIKIIGTKLIKIKNINFLSLRLILNLIFLINNQFKIKKGIRIPICLKRNIVGNLILYIYYQIQYT